MEFELKHSFKYGKGGEQEEATFLFVSSPSNIVIKHVTVLEKQLFKAIGNVTKDLDQEKQTKKDEKLEGKDIVLALSAGDADLEKCYEALKNILVKNAKINGDDKFELHFFDRMDYSDTKILLGEYISSFLFTSLES